MSLDFVSRNIKTRGKIKLTSFPRDHYIKCFVIHLDFHSTKQALCIQHTGNNCAIIVSLSCDTFEFDQGHVTKNRPITVLVLSSESLGIYM